MTDLYDWALDEPKEKVIYQILRLNNRMEDLAELSPVDKRMREAIDCEMATIRLRIRALSHVSLFSEIEYVR